MRIAVRADDVVGKRSFAMSLKRQPLLLSFAIAALSISIIGINIAQADGAVCEGQWATAKDCVEKSGGVWIQGMPLQQTDCRDTCENHKGFTHADCYTLDSVAAKICGSKHAVRKPAFPPSKGNKCGYGWWTISCQ